MTRDTAKTEGCGGRKLSLSSRKPDIEESTQIENDAVLLNFFLNFGNIAHFFIKHIFMSACHEFIILTLNQGFSTLAR